MEKEEIAQLAKMNEATNGSNNNTAAEDIAGPSQEEMTAAKNKTKGLPKKLTSKSWQKGSKAGNKEQERTRAHPQQG